MLTHSYRSIWISDLHLGTRACNAGALLDFLRCHNAERLYLVGDIVDGWNRGAFWYWNPAQQAIVEEIADWRRRGTEVLFLPGNHDETNLDLIESLFGSVSVQSEVVHSTAEGRRMLVLHGHQFDASLSSARWVSKMGGRAYTAALRINDWYIRERLRLDGRSWAAFLKGPFTKAVKYVSATYINEREVLRAVGKHHADGIICGHTHSVGQWLIGSIWYINDGDWIHNCTALAEDYDGTLRLVRWKPDPLKARVDSSLASEAAA